MKKHSTRIVLYAAFIFLLAWAVWTFSTTGLTKVRDLQKAGRIPLISGQWKIDRYAGTSGNQSMFYSIEDAKGRLVLIDGGWDQDGDIEQVMSVIRAHDNHVTAWIITHPHPDHVGAFNGIIRKYGSEIQIDQIYTTDVNRERYEETAKDYDVISAYEDFLQLTEGMDNITALKENDELDLIGLHMKVLHAWDEHVDAQENNLCNDGSLMFRLTGNKDSFLFCADTQKEMESYIYAAHGDELASRYVQCGHHGNWGLTEDFYTRVSPETAFIDAPASVTADTTGTYDCPSLIASLRNAGADVVTWDVPRYSLLFY